MPRGAAVEDARGPCSDHCAGAVPAVARSMCCVRRRLTHVLGDPLCSST